MKHESIIRSMTLEQKCALLSGADTFRTRGAKDVPSMLDV